MIKAVIFDMDGVIVDSEMIYISWSQKFFASYGIDARFEDLARTVGKANRYNEKIYLDIWKEGGEEIDFAEHTRRKQKYYSEDGEIGIEKIDYKDYKMDYLDETLKYLEENGYKMALASSSRMREINRVVDDNNIRGYFDVMVTGEDFEKSKPHPDVYLYVLKALGITAEEAIVIEDSQTGIASAKAAGIKTIARREERFGFSQEQADIIIDDLRGIINILENE